MLRRLICLLVALTAVVLFTPSTALAQARIALVIGNAAYTVGPLNTTLADAGLVAEALGSVGFEIVEGADLSQADLRAKFREFLDKVEAAGPDAIAFVYFAGYGVEFEGENYLIPVDAKLERDSDIPLEAVRISDFLRPLAASPARAKVMVLDASRTLPFVVLGARLARGLSAMEAPPGTLIAMSAAPGSVAEDGAGPYGSYATALAEMLREPGVDLATVFTRVRARTHQASAAKMTPWHVSTLSGEIALVPGGPDPADPNAAPPPVAARPPVRPMREVGPEEAYALAIEQDTLPAYVEYVQAYPSSAFAPRIWKLIRARREALAWLRAVERNTPESYWTYLRRYPRGLYAFDAERRLRRLSARFEPPPNFAPVDFDDVPPALADEPSDLSDDDTGPPPPMIIGPPSAYFISLPPPPPPRGRFLLPIPHRLPMMPRIAPPPARIHAPPLGAFTPPSGAGAKGPTGVKGPKGKGPTLKGPAGPIITTAPPGGTPKGKGTPAGALKKGPSALTVTTPPGGTPKGLPPSGLKKGPSTLTVTTPPGGTPKGPSVPLSAKSKIGTPKGPAAATGPVAPTITAPKGTAAPKIIPPAKSTTITPAAKGPPAAAVIKGPPAAAIIKGPPPVIKGPPPPPPPPPVVRAPPPPPPPPKAPPAAAVKGPPPGKKCEVVNGVQVCK